MYISSKRLTRRIQEISNEIETITNGALSFEECIALPYFGQIILRFELNENEFTLEDLDRYGSLLNEVVGDEFLMDFMGSVYKKAGVDYSTIGQRLAEMALQFKDEKTYESVHANGIREDAAVLLETAGLDANSPVWEIQAEDEEYSLLLMGKESKQLFTVEKPIRLSVMEVNGNACTGLMKATFFSKRNGISLARVLLNEY